MEKNKSDKDRWHEFRADHLIAIFTGLLFVANILLWLTTWKLVTSAKETARLDQRAWVVIESVTSTEVKIGAPLGIVIKYRNTGKTPALQTVSVARADALPSGTDPTYSYEGIQIGGIGVIGPNVDFIVALNPVRTPDGRSGYLDENGVNELFNSVKVVFVHGRITYRDIFNQEHWTNFCFKLSLGGNISTAWHAYGSHNDVDRD